MPQQHDSVVVTGTYEPMSLEEIDRAIRVLPARSQAVALNTLSDLLKLDASLDLTERAPNGIQGDLSIRGAGFGKTLVLLNGMRINDVQSGHHNMDIPVPLESVDRIEVMRGSGSTLYGADAVGGVINIVTAPPEATELRLRTALGSDGINQQRASLGIAGKVVSEQASFSRDFSTGFRPTAIIVTFSSRRLRASRPISATARSIWPTWTTRSARTSFTAPTTPGKTPRRGFAGAQQALGAKTTASFSYRRHSDLFVLYRYRRRSSPITMRTKVIRCLCAGAKRCR
jgi:iron complex outermembrane receptor protein